MSLYFPKPHGGFGKTIMVKLNLTLLNYATKSVVKQQLFPYHLQQKLIQFA